MSIHYFQNRTLRTKDLAFGMQIHIFTYQTFKVKSRKHLHSIVGKVRYVYGYTRYKTTMPVLASFRPEAALMKGLCDCEDIILF